MPLKSRIISTRRVPPFGAILAVPVRNERAAASASMALSLPSRRRVKRSGRLISTTEYPAAKSSRHRPAPKDPVPSTTKTGCPAQEPSLENAVTLTIGGIAALPKPSSIGRQGHGNMELLVGVGADHDV